MLNIKCPMDGCEHIFEDTDVERYINYYYYRRYLSLKAAAILVQNPNVRWCIRSGCDKYTIANPKNKKVVCECGAQICFKCSNEYHPFRRCQDVMDKVYKKYAKENNLQPCPQCNYRIAKDGGCDHITCA